MLCIYFNIEKFEKNQEVAAESGKCHHVPPLTLTCQKSVIWFVVLHQSSTFWLNGSVAIDGVAQRL